MTTLGGWLAGYSEARRVRQAKARAVMTLVIDYGDRRAMLEGEPMTKDARAEARRQAGEMYQRIEAAVRQLAERAT
jgi:hypothetical protein